MLERLQDDLRKTMAESAAVAFKPPDLSALAFKAPDLSAFQAPAIGVTGILETVQRQIGELAAAGRMAQASVTGLVDSAARWSSAYDRLSSVGLGSAGLLDTLIKTNLQTTRGVVDQLGALAQDGLSFSSKPFAGYRIGPALEGINELASSALAKSIADVSIADVWKSIGLPADVTLGLPVSVPVFIPPAVEEDAPSEAVLHRFRLALLRLPQRLRRRAVRLFDWFGLVDLPPDALRIQLAWFGAWGVRQTRKLLLLPRALETAARSRAFLVRALAALSGPAWPRPECSCSGSVSRRGPPAILAGMLAA